jgi:large subunit ribosomal protein L21
MYAVVTTGGKQVKVAQGDVIRVEKIDSAVGETVEIDTVNLVAGDEGIVVAPKDLEKAKVLCDVLGQGRRKKIRVFKKKRRKNYARSYGHRQAYTELRVREIVA